jgi:uncharacterized membrane protein YhaH (DUF805 family)
LSQEVIQMKRFLLTLVDPRGRTGRLQYFGHLLALFVTYFVLYVLAGLVLGMSGATTYSTPEEAHDAAARLLMFPFAYSVICVTVRRFHDLGRSGWYYLLFVIPVYNLYLAFLLWFVRGTEGQNAYGDADS